MTFIRKDVHRQETVTTDADQVWQGLNRRYDGWVHLISQCRLRTRGGGGNESGNLVELNHINQKGNLVVHSKAD